MMNITIAGNATKNAETKSLQDGSVTQFSVACNRRVRGQDTTTYFDVSMWGRRGEALAQYITKGNPVTVTGEFSTREYNGKTYFQVRASDVALQGGRQGAKEGQGGHTNQSQGGGYGGNPASDMDDEVPF